MPTWLIGGAVIAAGIAAAIVGIAVARTWVASADRAARKSATRSAASSENWHAWFVGPFSEVAIGTRWLAASLAGLAWALAGAGLIGLGLQLLGQR